jgi:hypothetical protein
MLFSSATPATTIGHPGKCSHLKFSGFYRSGTAYKRYPYPSV